MSQKKPKKKDGDIEAELKQNLMLDIDILENKIFAEQEKEVQALKEYEAVLKEIKEEEMKIENMKMQENQKMNYENENMREKISSFSSTITILEKSIREYDEDIKSLDRSIIERSEQYKRELEEKDCAINEQRKLFEDMSVRFQHILQRTANKLQERVNMGA